MITVFKPKINSVHGEDGYPYTETFDVLFSKHDDAISYASDKLNEHENPYSEPKAHAIRVRVFESKDEGVNYQDAELIESAKSKLTEEEIKALGL